MPASCVSLAPCLLVCLLAACGAQAHAEAEGSTGRSGYAQAPCFPVQRIALEGEAAQDFQWALDAALSGSDTRPHPAVPPCMGPDDIAEITRRVQGALIDRGFITTRVLVPAQNLGTGTLRLVILPGRLGSVRLQRDALGRGTAWNALPLRPDRILNLRDLEQGLENFQRVPTVRADIRIEPSEPTPDRSEVRPGDSDLAIQWAQERPFRLGLSVDDAGARGTGRYQGALTFSFDNALDLNDLLSVTVQQSLRNQAAGEGGVSAGHGNRGQALHYSLPWGHWLVALQASQQDYRQVVAGANQVYVYRGETRQQDLRLTRMVHRSAVSKTAVSLRGWSRQSGNFIDDTEIEVQRRRTAGWEFGVQHQRTAGPVAWSLGLAYRRGTGASGALAAPEEAFGEGVSRPRIVHADFSASLAVMPSVGYELVASGQWSWQSLVPQDRFSIGGRSTVRGFDGERTLSAARGWWLRQELQGVVAGSDARLYLGLDHGEVGGAASETLAGTRLTGMVIGLRGAWRRARWELFAGRPLHKPSMFRTADRTAGFSLQFAF